MMNIKSRKGFTLIELIVVIAVLGILVLLAMPKFLGYTEKSKVTVIRHDIKVTENKMTEMLMHGYEVFQNDPEWGGFVEKDLFRPLIGDGKLFETKGVVPETVLDEASEDYVDLSVFKIVPQSMRIEVGTNLTGDFYANAGGKVYYEREKGTSNPVTPGDQGDNVNDVFASNIEIAGEISKITVTNKITGINDYIYFSRIGLQNIQHFSINSSNSKPGYTSKRMIKIYEAGSIDSLNAINFSGNFLINNINATMLNSGLILNIDDTSIMTIDPGTEGEIRYSTVALPVGHPIIKKTSRDIVLYADGTVFIYDNWSSSWQQIYKGVNIVDIVGELALTNDGKVVVEVHGMDGEPSVVKEIIPGVVINKIIQVGIKTDFVAIASNGDEYTIKYVYSGFSVELNNGLANKGGQTVEKRGFKINSSTIEMLKEEEHHIEDDWIWMKVFEEIDLGELKMKDISKIAYGPEYILVLDKTGNVWAYGLYGNPQS